MIRQCLLILLSLLLLGCSTQPKKIVVKQPYQPSIHTEMSPLMKDMIMKLMYMRDPNIFKYKEPSLDEKFGISRYK